LQEHKLKEEKTKTLWNKIWAQVQCKFLHASPGYINEKRRVGISKGGVCMVVTNKWAKFIVVKGSIAKNRILWVQFDGIPRGKLGVGNIYAPNEFRDRCRLWEDMLVQLPSNCKWILVGDFNMVECTKDKLRCCNRFIS
jgi:hypothetical protein